LRKLLFVPLIAIAFFSSAQNIPSEKFGRFDNEQLTQTVFPIDSSAEAIILFEKMTSNFGYNNFSGGGWYIQNHFHIRKKILKKSAFDQGVITIPYYLGGSGKSESVQEIKGRTYNIDGNTELAKSSIFNEKIEKEYYQTKITFPNIKEGSIIEYEYVLESPLAVKNKPPTWSFQGSNPALWSEVEVTIPDYFYYKIMQSGYLPLELNEQTKVNVDHGYPVATAGYDSKLSTGIKYRFGVKNAPSFENEAYITTPKDYISKIGFELSQYTLPGDYTRKISVDWPDIDKTLMESDYWGRKLKKSNYLDNLVAELKIISDPKTKLQKAYDFLTKNFKWNEETGLWLENDLKKVFENKTGTASELNGIMIALLRELKFEADPIVLSTRAHGRVNFLYPQLNDFNYTIAHVVIDKDTMLVDVTDPFIQLGSLPQRCINEYGRLIKSASEGELIEIKPKDRYVEFESFMIKFNKDLTKLIGSYSGAGAGYLGHDLREAYKLAGDELFKKKIAESYDDLEIKNIKVENFDNLENQFTTVFDFEKSGGEADVDRIYIEPMMFGKVEKNPFIKTKREFPVNFGHATSQVVAANIEIPDGYIVEEVPKNIAASLPDNGGKFTYLIVKTGKNIQIQSKLNLNRPIYEAAEYEYLSQLYKMIVDKHAEQIVLKKK
jgi:Domain of Unknown Function with PDB structure (DUF3857)/Transglutaminase-like superfamily